LNSNLLALDESTLLESKLIEFKNESIIKAENIENLPPVTSNEEISKSYDRMENTSCPKELLNRLRKN
jgi:hypothetical protein